MNIASKPHKYHTLDALRGVAALLIVTRHSDQLFGSLRFPESYLAVDLFFVMSGFIIGQSYESRLLNGASPWKFFIIRLIRLYPLFLIGVSIAFFEEVWKNYHEGGLLEFNKFGIFKLLLLALMMTPITTPPLDGARWSLSFEIFVNFLYGFAIKFISTRILIITTIVTGIILFFEAYYHGSMDIGYQVNLLFAGLVRTLYSFNVGILLSRLILFDHVELRKSPIIALACIVIVGLCLAIHLPTRLIFIYDTLMVIVGFPILVLISVIFDFDFHLSRVFTFLGLISYGVYILHEPTAYIFEYLISHLFGVTADSIAPYGGFAYLVFIIGVSWAFSSYYDKPLRRFLMRRIGPLSCQSLQAHL